MHVDQKCLICRNCPRESALHLLFLCPYAVTVWNCTSMALGYQLMVPDISVQHIWASSCERLSRAGANMKILWASAFYCTVWHVWKQRNEVVFGGTLLPPMRLSERIVHECHMWKKFAQVVGDRRPGGKLGTGTRQLLWSAVLFFLIMLVGLGERL